MARPRWCGLVSLIMSMFENAVAVEIMKQYYMRGSEPKLYYWRDNKGLEIDFIVEKGGKPQYVIEVKASSTYDVHAWANIDKLADAMEIDTNHRIWALFLRAQKKNC